MGLRLAGIFLVAGFLALGNYVLNPQGRPVPEEAVQQGEIRLADALALRHPVLWIDARSKDDYAASHIPGALPLNEEDWNALMPAVLKAWVPGQTLVVYCSSQSCHTSRQVADRLRAEGGLPGIVVLEGGWESWLARQK